MKQSREHSKGDQGKGHQGHSTSSRKGKEQGSKGNAQESGNQNMEKGNKK